MLSPDNSYEELQANLEADLSDVIATLSPGLVPWNHKGNDPY